MKIQRRFWAVFVMLAARVVGQTLVAKAASEDGKQGCRRAGSSQNDKA